MYVFIYVCVYCGTVHVSQKNNFFGFYKSYSITVPGVQ